MTLKQYLHITRKPEYCGINARAQLKRYGALNSLAAPYREFVLHCAINTRDAELKHRLFRSLFTHGGTRMAATAL